MKHVAARTITISFAYAHVSHTAVRTLGPTTKTTALVFTQRREQFTESGHSQRHQSLRDQDTGKARLHYRVVAVNTQSQCLNYTNAHDTTRTFSDNKDSFYNNQPQEPVSLRFFSTEISSHAYKRYTKRRDSKKKFQFYSDQRLEFPYNPKFILPKFSMESLAETSLKV